LVFVRPGSSIIVDTELSGERSTKNRFAKKVTTIKCRRTRAALATVRGRKKTAAAESTRTRKGGVSGAVRAGRGVGAFRPRPLSPRARGTSSPPRRDGGARVAAPPETSATARGQYKPVGAPDSSRFLVVAPPIAFPAAAAAAAVFVVVARPCALDTVRCVVVVYLVAKNYRIPRRREKRVFEFLRLK